MKLIDADALKELFPDNGEGSWTYNATVKAYIDAQPTIQPDTTTHDSIPAETGKNDGDGTSGDCISKQQAIDAICEHGTDLERRGITVLAVANHKQATVDLLENLPSVQPERKTGRWTLRRVTYLWEGVECEKFETRCSSCGCLPISGIKSTYCPNCGADMRGKQNDSEAD